MASIADSRGQSTPAPRSNPKPNGATPFSVPESEAAYRFVLRGEPRQPGSPHPDWFVEQTGKPRPSKPAAAGELPLFGGGAEMSALLTAALAYARNGWPVLPCVPREKRPLTSHGYRDATTEEEVIRKWWTRWPESNVGLATGGGLIVLDVDGKAGEHALNDLENENGPLPETVEARTGGGGHHVFLRVESEVVVRSRTDGLGRGLDVKGSGGYVVVPPSRLKRGRYGWIANPFTTPIASAPSWLLARLGPIRSTYKESPQVVHDPRAYAQEVLAAEAFRVARAPVGTRNHTLNAAAFAVGRFVSEGFVPLDLAASFLRSAALRAGLERIEVERTLRSGLAAGMRCPKLLLASGGQRSLVWALPFSSKAKLLLNVLDSHANSAGWAWPSWETLRRECSFRSRETLADALREVSPVLKIEREAKGRGRPHNRYRIQWDRVRELFASFSDSPHTPQDWKASSTAAVLKSGLVNRGVVKTAIEDSYRAPSEAECLRRAQQQKVEQAWWLAAKSLFIPSVFNVGIGVVEDDFG